MTYYKALLLAVALLPNFLTAQHNARRFSSLTDSYHPWSVGVFVGQCNYWGDLAVGYPLFANNELAFGAFANYQISRKFGVRGGLTHGKLAAKASVAGRQASFERRFSELSLLFEYDFLGKRRFGGSTLRRTLSPYLVGGFLGMGFGAPSYSNELEDGSKISMAIPFGLGIRYDINSRVYVTVEHVSRVLFNGNMDGIAQWNNKASKGDFYNFGGIRIGFNLGSNDPDDDGFIGREDECPTIAGTLKGCPDMDGDKIPDKEDECPEIAGTKRFHGCVDTDGDGLPDPQDKCPNDKGFRRLAGCPDSDFDLIIDLEDLCPTVVGIPAMQGCPDADRDHITDADDKCPDDPGPKAYEGCPDWDNDGLPNNKDNCPESAGPPAYNGCPDTDGDGLTDANDKCPSLKGPAGKDGCPEVEAVDKALLDKAMHQISFRSGSFELLTSSKAYLAEVAVVMNRYPGFKLFIEGYTDNAGAIAHKQSLSETRAKACHDYLLSLGVKSSQMKYTGLGPTNPIADNKTEEGRIKNRRVVFSLVLE